MPGLLLSALGLAAGTVLIIQGRINLGGVAFDVGTLAVACMTVIIGFQLVAFGLFTKVFAVAEGLLPEDPKFSQVFKVFTLEKGIVFGLLVLLAGILSFARSLWMWKMAEFGVISYEENLHRLIPSVTLLVLGVQTIFSSFFMSVLGLKTASRKPPTILEK